MTGVVARPSIEIDWQSLGGYDFQGQGAFGAELTKERCTDDPAAIAASRTAPMANGAKGGHFRASNSAAQPHRFRTLDGQTNCKPSQPRQTRVSQSSTDNRQVSVALQPQSEVPGFDGSTYASAPALFASAQDFCPRQQSSSHTGHSINTNQGIQYAASDWPSGAVLGQPTFQQQHSGGPRRSTRLPPNNATPAIHVNSSSYGPPYNRQAALSQANNFTIPQPPTNPRFLAVNTYNNDMTAVFDSVNVPAHDIPSPVSHSGPHSRTVTPLPEAARKRTYSQLSHDAMIDQTSPDGYEDHTRPRKSRTIKRDDAPMNGDHKYFCNVSDECAGLIFDRKCEWGKHMDKHDRPYRCQHAQCAKLQGFTYSGGLLRHEREVHNKHGGPKAFLFCPHVTCKRHTEKGFTRKENLQEHIRRVHSDTHDPAIAPDLDQMEPVSAMSQATADELYAAAALSDSNKQEQSYDDSPSDNVHELREQVKSLQAHVRRLEDDARQKDARYAALEVQIQIQMQQGGR